MSSLRDKVTIITGASSGLGAEFARYFASHGAKLSLIGRNVDRLEAVVGQCVERGLERENIHIIAGDITDDNIAEKIARTTAERFGRIDILINNAAVAALPNLDIAMETYDDIMKTNVRAAFHLTQLVAPELKNSKGNIVNISASTSLKVVPSMTAYNVSKASLDHFTRCVAAELGPAGVRVNSINPGFVNTEIHDKLGATAEQKAGLLAFMPTRHVLGRIGRPDEIAKVVGFVASDDASFVTGAIIPVDGGFAICP